MPAKFIAVCLKFEKYLCVNLDRCAVEHNCVT